ncbi:MAG: SRPBCC family protein [Candidatus Omnitrophota bacterium]
MSSSQQESPKNEKVEHHFVFVEVPVEIVSPEIIQWGEASWWPRHSRIKFVRKAQGELGVGTRYKESLGGLFGLHWDVEVTKLVPLRGIEWTILNGLLKGYEAVTMEWRYNGTRIDYELHYQIPGWFNKIFWNFFYRKSHQQGIKMIMDDLRRHLIQTYLEKQKQAGEA